MTASFSAEDVLRAAVEKYAAHESYSDTGEVTRRIAATGTVHRITFSTLYQRPSFFRFTFFKPHPHPPLGHLVTEHAVGHDGTVGYSVAKRPDGTVERKSPITLEAAIAGVTGISAGSAHTIGRLLLPEVQGLSLLDLVDAHRSEDVDFEGKSCYSVTARKPNSDRQQELWIEKDSYLLRKRTARSEQGESVEVRENISIDSPQPNSLFAPPSDPIDMSKKRFIVSIYEVQQKVVFADEFTGRYTRSVTMADGTTRTVELTPMMRHGQPVLELKDTGGHSYMGTARVGTATQINGKLMVQVADVDDLEAARAEWRAHFRTGPVLPHNTSLTSIPEFVPPGFAQGIEIFNDSTTPMQFVTDVLTTHAGLSPEESRRTMRAIHTRGGALIPTPSFDEAQRIATQITAEAAKQGHPLLCRPVSIAP